jgi:sugar lactone lactonase YvrE
MTQLKSTRNAQYSFRSLLFAGAMLFALSLAGCGGGSGGDNASITQSPPPPPPPVASVPSITLFAGGLGGAGNVDGTPGRLSSPFSIGVDASNNIYIGDYLNCNIRKLSTSGLSVLMGGQSCYIYKDDGTFAYSTFALGAYPPTIISDRAGSLYLLKYGEPISRMAANGTLKPLPVASPTNYRIAIDTDGTVYEADGGGGTIYKTGANGNRSLLTRGIGTGLPSANATVGIALGDDGTIYVADADNQLVRKITRAGFMTTLAGTGTQGAIDGTAINAQFSAPTGIAVDSSGNVYIGDKSSYTIRKIAPDGVVSTLAGLSGTKGAADGKGAAARFVDVSEITVDRSGALIVADTGNSAIRRVSPDGVVTTIAGVLPSRGSNDGPPLASRFYTPSGLARDNAGNIYLGDTDNFAIRKLNAGGDVSTLAGKAGVKGSQDGVGLAATFTFPQSIALDQQGSIYVADYSLIRKISNAGEVKLFADAGSVAVGGSFGRFLFNRPRFIQSLAFDARSQLYAIETLGASISKVAPDGSFIPISCNCQPLSVTGDALGNIFIASPGMIGKISADGAAIILAGASSLALGWRDGVGANARFSNQISALAVDSNGNIFVCDTGNHTIRKITPSGVVTTIAGKAGIAGTTLGPLPGLLNSPLGIVIDNAGNLYVTTEDAVVKITLS